MFAVAGAWLAIAFTGKFAFGLTSRPFFWAEVAALALAMVPIVSRGVGNVALAYIGRLSYSMYLFHFAVIAGLEHWFGPTLPFSLALIATLAGTLAIGVVSQRTAEKWSQDAGRALIRSLGAARRLTIRKNK
jgi:peptidoglycan/LPS O-acetylase OafA/YrhL